VSDEYDVAVIGAGPAGEKASLRAAYFGKRVALLERAPRFGGACGSGGLASKILRESALVYRGASRRLADVLNPAPGRSLEMANFLSAVGLVCDAHYENVRHNIDRHHVEWIRGSARFLDPHRIAIGDREITAETIVIATGSRPAQPSFVPWGAPGVFHADTILSMREIPKRLVVVGGGVIGMEFASIFAALDVDVHVIEQRPQLLPFLDADVVEHLVRELSARGAHVHCAAEVVRCRTGDDGVEIETDRGERIVADAILFAAGRTANTDELDLDRAGVTLGRFGRPVVDEFFRTSAPHIYAVGDVIGFPALASTAMEQGRSAIGHALKDEIEKRADALPFDDSLPYALIPYGLYTIPSVAMVGKTEAELTREGTPYVAGVCSYAQHARGHLIGDSGGRLKLLCHAKTRHLLGAHIVGETAEELIHLAQACMHYEGTIDYFVRSVFNFPTLASLYKSAAYDALGKLGR
jgi:NAD(P) transhydrogenase